jgi:adenine phosphoribosyltransferase
MAQDSLTKLAQAVRDVPDFPKPGIIFKDITPVLANGELFRLVIGEFVAACRELKPDKIAGIDARGFIFGGAIACELGIGFIPIRKKGKLPYKSQSISYALEYGEATIEMHEDAIGRGERVVLLDDLLATGGTAAAAIQLIQQAGGEVVEAQFMIELAFLNGRDRLGNVPVRTLLRY